MYLPRKLLKGDIFKPTTVQTVNEIIDYLRALTPVAGNNITIDQKTTGFIINSKSTTRSPNTVNETTENSGYLGAFKLQLKTQLDGTKKYVVTNGTGATTSKAFVNGIEFNLNLTIITTTTGSATNVYIKFDLTSNSCSVEYASSTLTDTILYHYIGQIGTDGKIYQEWTGGIIYRTTATISAGGNIEVGGGLADIIQVRVVSGVPILEWKTSSDGSQGAQGAIILDGNGSHTMWPLTTCPVVLDYVNSQQSQ